MKPTAKPTVKGLPKSTDKVKPNPFLCVKSINEKGDPMDPEDVQYNYDAFLVNRSMSNTYDTALFANELNVLGLQDKLMAYHFYYFGVDRKPSRFGAWNKASADKDINTIKEYYGYSLAKAREVLVLLGDQLERMRAELDRGGRH